MSIKAGINDSGRSTVYTARQETPSQTKDLRLKLEGSPPELLVPLNPGEPEGTLQLNPIIQSEINNLMYQLSTGGYDVETITGANAEMVIRPEESDQIIFRSPYSGSVTLDYFAGEDYRPFIWIDSGDFPFTDPAILEI